MMSRQNYLMKRIHIARWSMYILFIYLSHVGSRKKWDIYPLQTQLVRNVKKIWNNHQYQREFQRPLFSVDLNVEVMRSTEIGLPEAKCVSADFARVFFLDRGECVRCGTKFVLSVFFPQEKCIFFPEDHLMEWKGTWSSDSTFMTLGCNILVFECVYVIVGGGFSFVYFDYYFQVGQNH